MTKDPRQFHNLTPKPTDTVETFRRKLKEKIGLRSNQRL